MSFCRKRNPVMFDYTINGESLLRVNNFNDLGILVSNNLSWDLHIESCVSKASQRLGLVKRTIGYDVSVPTKKLCYTVLVRPLLEHGVQLWSPSNKKKLMKLEKQPSMY